MSEPMSESHDTKMIINSQALKLLNHLIDNKVAMIVWMQRIIKEDMERLLAERQYPSSTPTITTRVSDEIGGRKGNEVPVLFHGFELKQLAEKISDIEAAQKAIGDLQNVKLRLLGDYDFTHGDLSEQYKIFGEPPAPARATTNTETPKP